MSTVGLVLSGGGARGAYEAGILAGIVEALGAAPGDRAPFQVVAGTSVGAINGAWTVANAHRADHGVDTLLKLWRGLRLSHHLRVDLLGALGWAGPFRSLRRGTRDEAGGRFGRSVLDPRALENIITTSLDWAQMHENIASNRVRGFVVAALHIGTGVTTMFAEMAPGAEFRPIKHPRRVARLERIEAAHVLASAAIPALFPARRVGTSYFADGSLRFNTPIAPAIRAGADKLVVITLRHNPVEAPNIDEPGDAAEQYPSAVFLLGKIFNALLLDNVSYDLQILERFNRMMEVLDTTLTESERARIDRVLVESRGLPYRTVETLTFEPSENIGILAGEHLRRNLQGWNLGRFYEWVLAKGASVGATWEADLASYLLFDGSWADTLIELGRKDARAKRDEIRHFFQR